MEAKDRIILPLDTDSPERAIQLANELKNHVGLFKIGLTLFASHGPSIVKSVKQIVGDRIFLDLKFHDIPQTVGTATRALLDACGPVKFITVHTLEGDAIIRAAVEAAKGETQVLGVTLLTSLSEEDRKELGFRGSATDHVLALSRMAKNAGCSGIVCSPREVQSVKKENGNSFIVVTPGIRPNWSHVPRDDQQRIQTPMEAISSGADYIVVGRPIYQCSNPVEAASRIAKEITEALSR